MFEEKPDFSTSDLHELHDRKLRNQFMIEQNRECQYYFSDLFSQENYFVWVREVFHKSRIPTKLNLGMQEYETFLHRFFLGITGLPTVLPTSLPTLEDIQDQLDDLIYGNDSCLVRDEIRCPER